MWAAMALAAVGSSTALINLLIAFSQGASVGAGVVVSQYIGAKDKRGLRAAVHTALTIAGILGLVLTVAGIFLSRQLLIWMQTPADVLEEFLCGSSGVLRRSDLQCGL